MFWKNGLSEKVALEYDLSCIIRKDDDLNYGISPDRKAKMKKKIYSVKCAYGELVWLI